MGKSTGWKLGLALAFLLVAVGWWYPNLSEWEQCGAPGFTATVRGAFGKPSTLECLSATINRPSTPSGDFPTVDQEEPHTCVTPADDPVCPQPSTPPEDPSCTWVVPADREPFWSYPDGTPC